MCIYTVASPTVDVLIIGGGVAGSSAALTVIRQRHTAIMFDTSRYRFDNSYYLHALVDQEHVSPKDLITKTHKELEQFNGFTLKNTEITKLEKNGDHFTATDKDGKNYRGKKVILAHGVATLYPQIEGYGDCWGKGIFHNLFAQAYNSDMEGHAGVLADGLVAIAPWTLHITHLSNQLVKSVTIYTNGSDHLMNMDFSPKPLAEVTEIENKPWRFETRKIAKFALKTPQIPESTAANITFEDGETVAEAFIGHFCPTKLNGNFAQDLNIELTPYVGDYKLNGLFNETSAKGVYAAGDIMTMFKVLPNAVASGAQAAAGVAVALQEEKHGLPPVWNYSSSLYVFSAKLCRAQY